MEVRTEGYLPGCLSWSQGYLPDICIGLGSVWGLLCLPLLPLLEGGIQTPGTPALHSISSDSLPTDLRWQLSGVQLQSLGAG